jgi:uncharacterized membrane protein YdjX (TVP38/TMEM64 family)
VGPVVASERSRPYRRVAIGVLVVAFVVIAIYVWRTGAVTPSSIRAWLVSLGPWGPVVFVAAFVGGALIGLPGTAFVVGARLAFGTWVGLACGYVGGVCAVCVPFLVARLLRRQAAEPWRPKQKLLARAFDQLETHPVRAMIVIRLFLWFNPPISYALALSPVKFRDYALGSAIALAPVVALGNLATGWFV